MSARSAQNSANIDPVVRGACDGLIATVPNGRLPCHQKALVPRAAKCSTHASTRAQKHKRHIHIQICSYKHASKQIPPFAGPEALELTYTQGVADVRRQSVHARSKDWRCRVRVTPARSPCLAHVACVPRLRQRQSISRALLWQ